jgi:hypothetical protein
MNLKHNKIRNTGILFELLVRQITTDTLNNRESKAVDILKKHYNGTQIAKEFRIYKTLSNAKNLSEAKANVIINAAVDAYRKINKSALKAQKYELIASIKENYNINEFFKAKVENYKMLASIYMLFEMDKSSEVDPDQEVKYRFAIMEGICESPVKEEKDSLIEEYNSYDKGTKALVYKLMIQKFNERYSDLDNNQKNLLKEYIGNISTTDKLKDYMNEEFVKVRAKLTKYTKSLTDEVRKVKLSEVMNFIEEIPSNRQICEKDIHNLLYYYELLKEFKQLDKATNVK